MRVTNTIVAVAFAISGAEAASNATFILPQGSGPYGASYCEYEVVDTSRLDPFNASHPRRIMLSRLDPIVKSECELVKIPYMNAEVAKVEDGILADYDFPTGLWAKFQLEVCKTAESSKQETYNKKFPIAILGGGLNTTRLFYSSLAQEIASQGFTVLTIDHPYDTDVVVFPNGDVIYGGRVVTPKNETDSRAGVDAAAKIRAQDASFVLDTFGLTKHDQAVIFGHSFGGAAAPNAMLIDHRFRAGINLDGRMYGSAVNQSIGSPGNPQAFMNFGSEGHNSSATSDPTWMTFWAALNTSPYVDYKKEFNIVNSSHGSYWDANLLVDVAGIRDMLGVKAFDVIGRIPGPRIYEILGRYIPSFFWYTLGIKPEDGILRGENGEFPDVELLRD